MLSSAILLYGVALLYGSVQNTFRNNNKVNAASVLHPGLGFNSSVAGSDLQVDVSGCTFVDDQGTPTQLYPIALDGNGVAGQSIFQGIRIHDCQLTPYGGGTSIGLADGSNSLEPNPSRVLNTHMWLLLRTSSVARRF